MNISEIRAKFPQYQDVPDGELVRGLHAKFYKDLPYADFLKSIDFRDPVDPTEGMGGLQKFNAGMGKAFTDVGQGASQLVGMGPSAEEVRDRRQLDAPLMNTGAGMAGNVAGNIAAFAPAALIPGAGTVAGAGAIGSIIAGLQPTESAGERFGNMGIGGVLGAGTQAVAGPVAQRVGEWAGKRQASEAARQSQNALKDATLKESQAAGYVVPPSAVNTSAVNRVLESVAGKAAVGQEASIRNQDVTNKLARKALGLGEDAPLDVQTLKQLRGDAGKVYEGLRSVGSINADDQFGQDLNRISAKYKGALTEFPDLGPKNMHGKPLPDEVTALVDALRKDQFSSAGAMDAIKVLRDKADTAFAQQNKSLGKAARAASDALEDVMERNLSARGATEALDIFRNARKQIAKTYTVEKAMNKATGDVSARVLGADVAKGKPLSGELATAGKFGQAFYPYAQQASRVPTPGVSKVGALASALMSGGGAAAAGPVGAAAGALPFVAPPAARSLVLSKPYQAAALQPKYGVGPITKGAGALADPETRRRSAMLARALALPLIPEAVNQ